MTDPKIAFLRSTAHDLLADLVRRPLHRDEALNTFARLNHIDPDDVLTLVTLDKLVAVARAPDAADIRRGLSNAFVDDMRSKERPLRWELLLCCVRLEESMPRCARPFGNPLLQPGACQ